MGNPKSNVSLEILVDESVPTSKENYIKAVMQPWRFKDYYTRRVKKPFDTYVIPSPTKKYAIVDSWNQFSAAQLVRFRSTCMCLVIFKSTEEFHTAMKALKPTSPYTWLRFEGEFGTGIELNSAGDARFSPLFMKTPAGSIEELYQLSVKRWKFAGITNWKDAKNLPPLETIVVDQEYTRGGVRQDKDYIYIFTDNLLRTSGNNEIPDGSWYSRVYGRGKCFPTMTQAVIRGLSNAFPITTMADNRRTQLRDHRVIRTWQEEIRNIQTALASGRFKGVKVFNKTIGQGTYSRIPDSLQAELDKLLLNIGILNGPKVSAVEPCTDLTSQTRDIYRRYFKLNPSMFYELACLGGRYVFTERFATTDNTQVRYYCDLLNEYYNLK